MKTLFTTLAVALTCMIGSAQVSQSMTSMQDFTQVDRQNSANMMIKGQKMNLNNIEGSIYYTDNFQSGKIYDQSRDKTINAYIRYRILDDMFEVKKTPQSDKVMTIKRGTGYDIQMNSQKFTFVNDLPMKINGTNSGYAMEMIKNKNGASLYKRMSQTFNEARRQQRSAYGSNNGREQPSVKTSTDYFIKIDGKTTVIEPSKRKADNAFPNHQNQLENYISNKNLRFRGDSKDTDLARLVNYYNSLQ